MISQTLLLAAVGCGLIPVVSAATAAAKPSPPNIVLILADDLGYGDLGCYGAEKIKTPNLDALAAEGMRFTDAYAPSPICCPTRYGVLSGIYPWRVPRLDSVNLWATHRSTSLLTTNYRLDCTLASHLHNAGYTTGAVGKWHQGLMNEAQDWNQPLQPGPLEAGFDWFFGDASNRYMFYIENHHVARTREDAAPIEGFDKTLKIPDSVWKINNEKNAEVLNDKACQFLRGRAGQDKPFFLYYCPNNVHVPLTPGAAFKGSSGAGVYGDFVQELDWSVGEVVKTLKETGALDNTLIVFSSDNGGHYDDDAQALGHRTTGGLLGQKGDVWEGGIRVPLIVRWPGAVPAGKVSGQPVSLVDLLPTLAEAVAVPLPEGQHRDGRSLLEVWKGRSPGAELAGRVVVANRGCRDDLFAIRQGDWVYLNGQGSGGYSTGTKASAYAARGFENSDIHPDGTIKADAPGEQLYNLKNDPGQKNNVIRQHPEKAGELRVILDGLKTRVTR
jgi:arylsulfatase A